MESSAYEEDHGTKHREPDKRTARKRVRKSRGKGLRTRTGCVACRTRHVKCDEERPRCKACRKSNRECVFISSVDSTTRASQFREYSETASEETTQTFTVVSNNATTLPEPPADTDAFRVDMDEPSEIYEPGGTYGEQQGSSAQETSPMSSISTSFYSAETAPLRWFDMLATDAETYFNLHSPILPYPTYGDASTTPYVPQNDDSGPSQHIASVPPLVASVEDDVFVSTDDVQLTDKEIPLFQHFVQRLSAWIDITDPGRSFSVVVPSMALRNIGLMKAILTLASRHLSLQPTPSLAIGADPIDRTLAVQYYNGTLQYLQQAMKNPLYLRSDELLATVLIISTYEMIDGQGRGWEKHLKGVFYIQRSQLIHGESHGLKKWIWWAWLRQDIWAAFKERRKILSFYTLTVPCSDLDFWALVNRSVFLLGQCVNYASLQETQTGRASMQQRIERGHSLWASLEQWTTYFERFDRRLPVLQGTSLTFDPIWINPPAASLAIQVHHFAKLLLLDFMPASEGLRELATRSVNLRRSVRTICGIASCTTEEAALIISTQCLFAAAEHAESTHQRDEIDELLRAHQNSTGWPLQDV